MRAWLMGRGQGRAIYLQPRQKALIGALLALGLLLPLWWQTGRWYEAWLLANQPAQLAGDLVQASQPATATIIQQTLWLFQAAGLMIVGLLAGLVYLVIDRQGRLAQAVTRRTREISDVNAALERDILRRQQAEETLRETQRALSTLLSNLPGMAYRSRNDTGRTMQFVSEGCLELTGYQPADLLENLKISYMQLIHPEDRKSVWDKIQAALRENQPFQLIYLCKIISHQTLRVKFFLPA